MHATPFDPSIRTLRQFAGLWILFFGGLAAWKAFGSDSTTAALVLAALAATIGPLGLAYPAAIRPVFVGWMTIAFPIGWVVSHLLLLILFCVFFTPLALVFRVIGRDALSRRPDFAKETYWTAKPVAADPSNYFRQF
jgi:hypothetical protein